MSNWDDDELLMDDLRAALAAGSAVSERSRRDARAAFAWRTIDEELMALEHDSLEAAGALVRGPAPASVRVLALQARDYSVEFELADGRLLGQVIPSQQCRIAVRSPNAPTLEVDSDEAGFFSVEGIVAGPMRLVVQCRGSAQSSPWIVV